MLSSQLPTSSECNLLTLFSIYQVKEDPGLDAVQSDICIATSTAPTCLSAYHFKTEDSTRILQRDFQLVDGGVAANNPTLVATSEVTKEITRGSAKFFPFNSREHNCYLV